MASLVTVKGPNPGRRFPLVEKTTIIGRQPDAAIYLESLAVSRHHARIVAEDGLFFIEDLTSSNGTFVNGHRIAGRMLLSENDLLQSGPYELSLAVDPASNPLEPAKIVQPRILRCCGWKEGPVDKKEEHLELVCGGFRGSKGCVSVALVSAPKNSLCSVQLLIGASDEQNSKMLDSVRKELDFYLIEKGEANPWAYAQVSLWNISQCLLICPLVLSPEIRRG